MVKLKAVGTITCEKVENIYKRYPNEKIIIVMPNTKEQSASEMAKIAIKYPMVIFSITGGLNPDKRKFNNEHYQKRTYYSAMELSKIIDYFRGIEKQIDLGWTETQKAMFIYQELCNRMQYSENLVNGRDYARGIGGVLYNKAVCSGFAMIYKEALDRIGLECHYQNVEGHHSWNIAKLDGKYRALELTWDTYNKGTNGCGFKFFNRKGQDFYDNKHHNIQYESEEHKFPITPYPDEELIENLRTIRKERILRIPLDVSKKTSEQTKTITINGIPHLICKSNDGTVTVRSLDPRKALPNKSFTRKDGSQFVLIQYPQKNKNGTLNKFLVIKGNESCIQIGKIYSEEVLTSLPREYDWDIANGLLSADRLKRKINNFNGYVGYVGQNHSIYYDQNIERNRLNIIR